SRKQITQRSHEQKSIVSNLETEGTDISTSTILHQTTEESNILKLQNIENVQTRQVPWRKTRVASLSITDEQTLETKHWRKPRREEDSSLITDQTDGTETESDVRHVRLQSKSRPDLKPLYFDKSYVTEDSTILDVSKEDESIVKKSVKKETGPDDYQDKQVKEQVPWTQEAIKLRRTKVEKTPIAKEKFEDVSLKPVRKSSLQKTETVLLEDSLTSLEDTVILKVADVESSVQLKRKKEILPKTKDSDIITSRLLHQTTEETNLLDLKQTEDILDKQTVRDKQDLKPSEKQTQEKVPWTQESIKLRPTKVEKAPIAKEKFEDVELKPLRRSSLLKTETVLIEDSITAIEDTVILKVTDDKSIEQIKTLEAEKPSEEQQEPVSWRVGKRRPKEETSLAEIDLKPVMKPKVPEEEKPQEVKLKPVKKVQPEDTSVEEVVLKPVRKQQVPEEKMPDVKLKPVRKEKPTVELQPEEVSWRMGKRRPKEEPLLSEVDLKPISIAKVPAEEKPEEVKLKPVKKAHEEEMPQEVKLEPVRKEKPSEDQQTEEVSWRVGKRRPKEEPTAEEVHLKTIPKSKAPEEENPDELKLKPVKKVNLQEEINEEVKLKPVKKVKPEELPLEEVAPKPVSKQKELEEKPGDVKLKPVKREKL
ncbi:jg26559, partial [Pararge aegeria aegeria]